VHSVASGMRNIDTLFFMLGWAWCGFHKKCAETRYAKLMFLHLVGSVGHEVCFGASSVLYVDALFFMLGWARCGFHVKHVESHYADLVFLHPVGSVGHVVRSGASGP
jgi:hypothetical protein